VRDYFSNRDGNTRRQVTEEISSHAWGGIVALLDSLTLNGAFGLDFPEQCPDGAAVTGTNHLLFALAVRAEIPELVWPLDAERIPPTPVAMDLIEFGYAHVTQPTAMSYHSFFRHSHLAFDREEGRIDFRQRVNRILVRNLLRYELTASGEIHRLSPVPLDTLLGSTFAPTGDHVLDGLLVEAMRRFSDASPLVRRDGLEKLWDAWERAKTLSASDKKRGTKAVLDAAASQTDFRETLETEAREVTRIGNTFRIRHSETSQIVIETDAQVDYLFYRLFALLWLLLGPKT
jgi:hypothetical protein